MRIYPSNFRNPFEVSATIKSALAVLLILLLAGCASLIGSVTSKMANNLNQAILNQNDLQTVRDGAPAYLLMIDSFIAGDRDNTELLLSGANLYASYTTLFIDDELRAKELSTISLQYAKTALCLEINRLCQSLPSKQPEFLQSLSNTSKSDLPVLYGFAGAWAGWIQRHSDDWNAVADLPKLTALFEHCVKLDESFDHGGAHLYLAVLASQLPPALGGKPEIARDHFERARELSKGHNLLVNVFMAQYYARTIFDQELHDQLLQNVLDDSGNYTGFKLINAYAKQRASLLIAESADYF